MYALNNGDISGYLTGSTMPKLTQGNMNRIPILAPSLAEQRAIAGVLGALDDKIELNRRMSDHEPFISPVVTREIAKARSPRRERLERVGQIVDDGVLCGPVGDACCDGEPDHRGYPPDKQEKATATVLQQAKLLCADWAG